MRIKKIFIRLLYWAHLAVIIIWFGLFLVPSCLWAGKIIFHFWFIMIITGIQFLWGLFMLPYTKKIDIICPLTTLMQKLRGFPVRSRENLSHSYIAEVLRKFKIKLSYKAVNIILIATIIIVSIQYIYFI